MYTCSLLEKVSSETIMNCFKHTKFLLDDSISENVVMFNPVLEDKDSSYCVPEFEEYV